MKAWRKMREVDWIQYFQCIVLAIPLMKDWICNESKTDK